MAGHQGVLASLRTIFRSLSVSLTGQIQTQAMSHAKFIFLIALVVFFIVLFVVAYVWRGELTSVRRVGVRFQLHPGAVSHSLFAARQANCDLTARSLPRTPPGNPKIYEIPTALASMFRRSPFGTGCSYAGHASVATIRPARSPPALPSGPRCPADGTRTDQAVVGRRWRHGGLRLDHVVPARPCVSPPKRRRWRGTRFPGHPCPPESG